MHSVFLIGSIIRTKKFGRKKIGGKPRVTEIPEGGFAPQTPPTTTFQKRRLRRQRTSTQRSAEKFFGRKFFWPKTNLRPNVASTTVDAEVFFLKSFQKFCGFLLRNVNLLLKKGGCLTEFGLIWFRPACTAQSANPSSEIWFQRPVEPYISH